MFPFLLAIGVNRIEESFGELFQDSCVFPAMRSRQGSGSTPFAMDFTTTASPISFSHDSSETQPRNDIFSTIGHHASCKPPLACCTSLAICRRAQAASTRHMECC